MFSPTHPSLPSPEEEIVRIKHATWEDIWEEKVSEKDKPIILEFIEEPDLSPLLRRIFLGELWHGNASTEEQDIVHEILAGIVDGDGCISGTTEHPKGANFKVKFAVSIDQHVKDLQVCYIAMFWFRLGKVYSYKGTKHNGADHSMREWKVDESNAVWVCSILAPKMLLKKQQVELVASKPYIMFKETETYEVSQEYVTTYSRVTDALRVIGAPLDLQQDVPTLQDPLGTVRYFIPGNDDDDDGKMIRWIRLAASKSGLKPKYQVLIAPKDSIRIFTSRTDAGTACGIKQSSVTQVANGARHSYGGHVFWSHSRWVGADFEARSKRDREERASVLKEVKTLNKAGRDVDTSTTPSHAYMAGFFAAEGCIIPSNKTGATITVGQTYRGICDIFCNTYATGNVHVNPNPKKPFYHWSVRSIGKVHELYNIWRPYLVAKMRDYRSILTTLGMDTSHRYAQTHRAREQSLPLEMKTERRDKSKRQDQSTSLSEVEEEGEVCPTKRSRTEVELEIIVIDGEDVVCIN